MGRPYSAGLLGVGSVKCEGREGGGGVPGVSWEVAIPDISLWGGWSIGNNYRGDDQYHYQQEHMSRWSILLCIHSRIPHRPITISLFGVW